MAKELQVAVVGALGKMGRETVKVLKKSDNLILAAAVDVKAGNAKVSDITGDENDCLPIWPDLDEALDSVGSRRGGGFLRIPRLFIITPGVCCGVEYRVLSVLPASMREK